MKNGKKNKGITLIALVITVIILLILAGITLATLKGKNGVVNRTKQAKEMSIKMQAEEEIKLVLNEWQIAKRQTNMTFEEFLDTKVQSKEIDEYRINGADKIEIYRNGYYIVVDREGNIVEEIQKAGIEINNLTITLEDGTEAADYSQKIGTPLIINFDVSVENGKLIQIEPELPFKTDGQEKTKTFKITSKIKDITYIKEVTIDFRKKYGVKEPEIKPNTTDYTNEDVIVEVDYGNIDESYTKEISIDGGNTYSVYTQPVKIEKNTIVKARIRGEIELESSLEISYIDKLEPNDFVPTVNDLVSSNQLEIKASDVTDAVATNEYGCSGIKWYKYFVYQGENLVTSSELIGENSWIASGLTVGESYNIAVEAYDKAGNMKSGSMSYTKLPVYSWQSYSTIASNEYTWSAKELGSFTVKIERYYSAAYSEKKQVELIFNKTNGTFALGMGWTPNNDINGRYHFVYPYAYQTESVKNFSSCVYIGPSCSFRKSGTGDITYYGDLTLYTSVLETKYTKGDTSYGLVKSNSPTEYPENDYQVDKKDSTKVNWYIKQN